MSTAKEEILGALKKSPCTFQEILSRSTKSGSAIRQALYRLKKAGYITMDGIPKSPNCIYSILEEPVNVEPDIDQFLNHYTEICRKYRCYVDLDDDFPMVHTGDQTDIEAHIIILKRKLKKDIAKRDLIIVSETV